MKFIPLTLVAVALLATPGCLFVGHREHRDDRDRPGYDHNDEHPPGVDHGEHPGDMDQEENE